MILLAVALEGEEHIIRRIGVSEQEKQHLKTLGFVVGASVKIISETGGNLIVKVKETRIAISRESARKIMV